MKKKFLAVPFLVIIISIIIGVGGVAAALLIGGAGAQNDISLQKGLVGWWKMDGNLKDSTSNSNHGTGTGVILTTDHKSQANKAYIFNGSTDFIDAGNSVSLKPTDEITIEAWIKTTDGNSAGIVDSLEASGSYNGYTFMVRDENKLALYSPNIGWVLSNTPVSDGLWHHVAVVVAKPYGAGMGTFYLDGKSNGTFTSAALTASDATRTIKIGKSYNNDYFVGTMDDVRIYKRALSQAEITASYEAYDPGIVMSDLQKGLAGNWKMNGNLKDSTSNSNHGTGTGVILTTDRKSQANKAYSFNGTDDYIDAGNGTSLMTTGDFTISWWANPGSTKNQMPVSKGVYITDGYYIVMNSDGQIGLTTQTSGTQTQILSNTGQYSTGSWQHFVVTKTGSVGRVYKNGVELAKATDEALNNPTSNTRSLIIGDYNSGGWKFNGSLDDVRVYNRALNQTEITASYEEYDPGIVMSDLQKGLVGNWKMNGNAKDLTPNSNHGTLSGDTALTTDRKSQANKAYTFDGTGDYIDAGSGSSLNITGSGLTISAWVKPTSDLTFKHVVSKSADASNRQYNVYLGNTASPVVGFVLTTSGGQTSLDTTATLTADVWSLVTAVYDGSQMIIYINGTSVKTGDKTGTITTKAANTLIGIFTTGSANSFKGGMDDVRIYNRALSAAEILALYESY